MIRKHIINKLRRKLDKLDHVLLNIFKRRELRLIGKLRADNPINEDNSFTRYIQVMPNEADVLGDRIAVMAHG